jgi:hypothetical protein
LSSYRQALFDCPILCRSLPDSTSCNSVSQH